MEKRRPHHRVYPAMDFIMKEQERTLAKRPILVSHTTYPLTVAYLPEIPETLEHEAFAHSFQITPKE